MEVAHPGQGLPADEYIARHGLAQAIGVYHVASLLLLRLAEQLGYRRERYVQKCHLCWQVRKFLRPHFPQTLGPDEIYGPLRKQA